MRWLAGRQQASTGQPNLPPNAARLPATVLVDPTTGYLHIISAPGQFAVHGSAQPYLTQRRLSRRRAAGVPQPRHGAAAQVPPESAGRHRAANTAHGRHAARTPGRGRGSWFKRERGRNLLGLTRAEWKEVRAETVKFTTIGWTGLGANMLGVLGSGGTLNGPTSVGLAAAMAWAPFQGLIAGIVNVSKMRKALGSQQALRNELVEAGVLPPTPAAQAPGTQGPQGYGGPGPYAGQVPTAPAPGSYQARGAPGVAPTPQQSYPQGAYGQGRSPAAQPQPREAERRQRGNDGRDPGPRHRGPEPRQPGS